MKTAILGAGAGGLVAARELLRHGHSVVVYEQAPRVGGVWAYDVREDSHTSMYASLRTNLPRESMGFRDFPFSQQKFFRDPRRFPGHEEVLHYLDAFAEEFQLLDVVRFNTTVVRVRLSSSKWIIHSRKFEEQCHEEEFEAVIVCNGHYFEPRHARIPGVETWPGQQCHSHNYRTPEKFRSKVVVVIGNSSSGTDISDELTSVAKQVHLSARTWDTSVDITTPLKSGKLFRHPMVAKACEDGSVHFTDGTSVAADVILHCTGYLYDFPFLDTGGLLIVDDNRVCPLYEHVFLPTLGPSLSFVGLPFIVIPFPLMELQTKWIAMVLAGKVALPSEEDMLAKVHEFYNKLEQEGVAKRHTHSLAKAQFEYCDRLAQECGCHETEEWRREMYWSTRDNKKVKPDEYRDVWMDHAWLQVFNRESC